MFKDLLFAFRSSDLPALVPVIGAVLVPVLAVLIVRRWLAARLSSGAAGCPRCGSATERVQRTSSDRLVSLILPVRRFRCGDGSCGWSGLVARPAALDSGDLLLARAAAALILFVVIYALIITAGFLLAWLRSRL